VFRGKGKRASEVTIGVRCRKAIDRSGIERGFRVFENLELLVGGVLKYERFKDFFDSSYMF